MSFANAAHAGPQPAGDTRSRVCVGPPSRIGVASSIGSLAVSIETSFGQLSALARNSSKPLRHRPFGFYLDRIAYHVETRERPDLGNDCDPEVEVSVDIALVDRHVEIASDIARDPCLFQAALEHYRHHAAAAERVFGEFTRTLGARMQASVGATNDTPPDGRSHKNRNVHAIFEEQLLILDREREEAQVAVDSSAEIDSLIRPACST